MELPKSTTSVTSFSKLLALVLFIALPFLGFYLGQSYGKSVTKIASETSLPSDNAKTSCTNTSTCSEEAKECPDGSFVFRQQPNCEFAACSSLKIVENITPSPKAVQNGKTKEDQIAIELSQKTGITQLDLIITYANSTSETNTYAGGTYTSKKRGTAGRFIASKINGTWKVTSLSSGIPLCSDIAPYFYPKELVPACKDGKGNITAR